MKILVCDPIAPKGIELFQQRSEFDVVVLDARPSEDELVELATDAAAIVVRSETTVTARVMDAAKGLKIVGRAGVGVDNIDVDAATDRGIVVMNTPGGNTISTAELTFSMLMSLARKIPQAHMSMKNGEWNRKAFKGQELFQKTLGILGMGRIGGEVAKRAQAFGMDVVAYDPYMSKARAQELQVALVDNLEDVFPKADFITVHMPLTNETRGMLNAEAFGKMKKGVKLINCARGGIIHETDIVEAIASGQVAGAALDVYETEPLPEDSPLRGVPNIVQTPHLGASTSEAQENVGIEVAETITEYLLTGSVRNGINMPNLDEQTYARVKPYLSLGEKLGRVLAQISPKRNDRLVVTFGGSVAEAPGDPITRYVLKGFLEGAGGKDANQVNVRSLANGLGLVVEEVKSNEKTYFHEWLHVAAHSGEEKYSVSGICFGARHEPRVERMNSQWLEFVPEGVILILENKDKPGLVGHLGTTLAKHGINIANMSLSRSEGAGTALTALNLDSEPPQELVDALEADPDLANVRVVRL